MNSLVKIAEDKIEQAQKELEIAALILKKTREARETTTLPYCGFSSIEDLKEDTARLFKEAIVVPNHLLPEEYQNHKEWDLGDNGEKIYGPTLAQIENHYNKKYAESDERRRHAEERARRVENYRAQVEATGEFEYDEFVLDAVSSGRPSAEIGELF